jgi:hypothetical protein
MKKILILILLIAVTICCCACGTDLNIGIDNDDSYNYMEEVDFSIPLGISFPPSSTAEYREKAQVYLEDLNIDRIKLEINWQFVETEQGYYDWDNLDERIDFYNLHNVKVFACLKTLLPTYLINDYTEISINEIDEFRDFVSAFINRYSSKLYMVQVGNEWDGWGGFAGSESDYVAINNVLYEETKKVIDLPVVLGAVIAYPVYKVIYEDGKDIERDNRNFVDIDNTLEKFKENALENKTNGIETRFEYVFSNANYDKVDIHLYDEAELFPYYIDVVKQFCDKPIIVSEFGAPNPDYEIYDDDYHYERIKKCMEVMNYLDIEEVYYFSLVDHDAYHKNNGLLDEEINKKPAYYLIKNRNTI